MKEIEIKKKLKPQGMHNSVINFLNILQNFMPFQNFTKLPTLIGKVRDYWKSKKHYRNDIIIENLLIFSYSNLK